MKMKICDRGEDLEGIYQVRLVPQHPPRTQSSPSCYILAQLISVAHVQLTFFLPSRSQCLIQQPLAGRRSTMARLKPDVHRLRASHSKSRQGCHTCKYVCRCPSRSPVKQRKSTSMLLSASTALSSARPSQGEKHITLEYFD